MAGVWAACSSARRMLGTRKRRSVMIANQSSGAAVLSLRDELSKQSRLLLLALCGAAICLLVIACANLANLLLVRSLARQKELSIRISLGANRRSILRQLLSESLILGVAGGLGAIGVAAGRSTRVQSPEKLNGDPPT